MIPLATSRPASLASWSFGTTPMPTMTKSTSIDGAVGEFGADNSAIWPIKVLQSGLFANDDIMGFVNHPHDVSRLLGGDALEDPIGHFDDGDLKTAMAGDGRRLEPDIAAADDKDTAARAHFVGQQVGVALVAGDIDALEIAADRRRQRARRRAVVSASVP